MNTSNNKRLNNELSSSDIVESYEKLREAYTKTFRKQHDAFRALINQTNDPDIQHSIIHILEELKQDVNRDINQIYEQKSPLHNMLVDKTDEEMRRMYPSMKDQNAMDSVIEQYLKDEGFNQTELVKFGIDAKYRKLAWNAYKWKESKDDWERLFKTWQYKFIIKPHFKILFSNIEKLVEDYYNMVEIAPTSKFRILVFLLYVSFIFAGIYQYTEWGWMIISFIENCFFQHN